MKKATGSKKAAPKAAPAPAAPAPATPAKTPKAKTPKAKTPAPAPEPVSPVPAPAPEPVAPAVEEGLVEEADATAAKKPSLIKRAVSKKAREEFRASKTEGAL